MRKKGVIDEIKKSKFVKTEKWFLKNKKGAINLDEFSELGPEKVAEKFNVYVKTMRRIAQVMDNKEMIPKETKVEFRRWANENHIQRSLSGAAWEFYRYKYKIIEGNFKNI